ncbi:MAG: hypothetical protein SVT52_08560 [Planctomycetota bacterium]|nr:hypothetical protein [Planctomycetota bacterium]
MIYAAFTFWLVLILFTGIGVYRLWTSLLKPLWVNWALLPGTVVSEMAYIFGCLITGGEIRRAKLIDTPRRATSRRASAAGEDDAGTEATPKLKIIGPIIAALVAIVGCGAGILVAHALLGEPVIQEFVTGGGLIPSAVQLPQKLPTGWDALWQQIEQQIHLLRRMAETWGRMNWLNWRVGIFVYLAACLSIRLAPVRRPIRPTLAAVLAIAAVIAVIAAASRSFKGLMKDLWPLLTYIWTSLLFLLVITLLIYGLVLLVRVLVDKSE